MRNKWTYEPLPYTYNTPLDVEEAEMLVQHPESIRSIDLEHLYNRVLVTAMQVRTMRSTFDNESRRRQVMAIKQGTRQVLDPEQAVKYLNPEQIENLFDSHKKQQLAYISKAVADLLAATVVVTDELAGILSSQAHETSVSELKNELGRANNALTKHVQEIKRIYSSLL